MISEDKNDEASCNLTKCLFFSSAKLARTLGRIAEEIFYKTGLSPSHALLLYLVNKSDFIQQKELGEKLHLTPSTITRFIEKLERCEYVSKTTEGKNVYVSSTDRGLELQDEILKAWHQLFQHYQGILTEDEIKQFIIISNKLMDGLEPS